MSAYKARGDQSRGYPSKGDWICSDVKCGNLNFSKRDSCKSCGMKKRPANSCRELGKDGAERSKGLFGPDDWICKSCGNVNWSRRSVCNVCNTARVSNLGERTGYGGGFMERDEVVEYKRRNDSDDEYDEYGRKKKRQRNSKPDASGDNDSRSEPEDDTPDNASSSLVRQRLPSVSDSGEEEEEEESGDDGDLSKYDLWSGEDKEDGTNAKAEIVHEEPDKIPRDSPNVASSSDSGSESETSDSSSSASSSSSSQRSGSSTSSPARNRKVDVKSSLLDRSGDADGRPDRRSDHSTDGRNRSRFERGLSLGYSWRLPSLCVT